MTWHASLETLEPISLAELNERAALLTRIDRKYVVPQSIVKEVLNQHGEGLRALEIDGSRASSYRSVYLDSPGLDCYLAAARRRPHRFKVRRRDYLDSGESMIEVKLRSPRGGTVKHRAALPEGSEVLRMVAMEDFASQFPEVAPLVPVLQPTVTTTYVRSTLLHANGRVTIDAHVAAVDAYGAEIGFGDALIVETKSDRGAGQIDRALWQRGIRPARLSKYATSLAAMRPELPANRWHRTLDRYLAA